MIGRPVQLDPQPGVVVQRVLRDGVADRFGVAADQHAKLVQTTTGRAVIGDNIVRPDQVIRRGPRRAVNIYPFEAVAQRTSAIRAGAKIIALHFVAGRIQQLEAVIGITGNDVPLRRHAADLVAAAAADANADSIGYRPRTGNVRAEIIPFHLVAAGSRQINAVTRVPGDYIPLRALTAPDLIAQNAAKIDPIAVAHRRRPRRVQADIVSHHFVAIGIGGKKHSVRVAGDHVPFAALTAPDLIVRAAVKIDPIAVAHRRRPRRVQTEVVAHHFVAGGEPEVHAAIGTAGNYVPAGRRTVADLIARAAGNIDSGVVGVGRRAVRRRTEITAKDHIVRAGRNLNGGGG